MEDAVTEAEGATGAVVRLRGVDALNARPGGQMRKLKHPTLRSLRRLTADMVFALWMHSARKGQRQAEVMKADRTRDKVQTWLDFTVLIKFRPLVHHTHTVSRSQVSRSQAAQMASQSAGWGVATFIASRDPIVVLPTVEGSHFRLRHDRPKLGKQAKMVGDQVHEPHVTTRPEQR